MTDQATGLDDETSAFVAPVFQVVRDGAVETMRGFLDHGLPPNLANENGDSLLMPATDNENEPVACLLLDRGADPDHVNGKGQKLAGLTFNGNLALVKALVAHGAAVDGAADGGADLSPLPRCSTGRRS